MRCLYCGKELALFKRLRGGEFCSDSHRQRYQDEYTQLALNRLLQANSTSDEPAPKAATAPPVAAKITDPSPAMRRRESRQENPPKPAPAPAPEPVVSAAAAPPAVAPPTNGNKNAVQLKPVAREDSAPEMSGRVLLTVPQPVKVRIVSVGNAQSHWTAASTPELPRVENIVHEPAGGDLTLAGKVAAELPPQADFPTPPHDPVEVRDFARSSPLSEVKLKPAAPADLDLARQPLEISGTPQRPGEGARLWHEDPCWFEPASISLGELARLDFETTGFEEPAEAVEAPEPPVLELPETIEAVQAAPVHIEPAQFEPPRTVTPIPFEPVRVDPVFIEHMTAPAQAEPEKPPVEAKPVAEAPRPFVAPDLVTKPVPVTLHGLAPAAGKPAQIFSAALVRSVEILTPRQNSLPLRPLMILGPAEAPAQESAKPESRKETEPNETAPPAPEKPRKSDGRMLSLHLTDPPRQSEPKKSDRKKKAEAKAEPKPELKPQPVKPGPVAVPEPDLLGLPKLTLGAPQQSAWSRLSSTVRVSIIGAVLAAGAAGVFLISRGSGAPKLKTAVSGPAVVEDGPALPTDAGWITDWFTDTNRSPERARHVDVLRGTLTLRDFRLDLEGQIEQGALGWVFRANKKSFYVEKVAISKPGLDPEFALVHFTVVDGKEQARQQVPLKLKTHLDTLFRVRLEAVGSRFTTWVQDEQVDQWDDDRFGAGGIGVYYDPGDSSKLKGSLHIVPLKQK